jgi:RHS repeat-associated protein
VGNRTQKTSTIAGYPGGLTNYNANDQISTDSYDNDGNTTASNGVGYVYDFENHLVQAGGGISIVYDGDGNRVSKTVAGMTTTYLVDDQNPTGYSQVVYESTAGSSAPNREVSHTFVYGLEPTLEQRVYLSGGNFFTQTIYFVFDGHGSVRALTDQTGAVTDTYDYDAFGNLLHSTGTTYNNYRYSGEQFDPDLNLYFNRARYLNTSTGRFWTTDTFEGNPQTPLSLHKYLYANADPVNMRDPSGREGLVDVLAAVGIFGVIQAISAPSTAIVEIRPSSYEITLEQVTKDPTLGFYKQFRAIIHTQGDANRFLVVQWVRGSLMIDGQFGILDPHQGELTRYNFPDWVIDSESQLAEYPGYAGGGVTSLTKNGSRIKFYDEPGASAGGHSYVAALDFSVNVYDRLRVSNSVSAFRSVDDPKPLLSIPWGFHDSYVVP